MANNRELSENETVNSESNDEESMKKKLDLIQVAINLIESRTLFVRAKLSEGNVSKGCNRTQTCMDVTQLNKDAKVKLNELWTAVEDSQLKSAGLRKVLYNAIAYELLSKYRGGNRIYQSSISGLEGLADDIVSNAVAMVPKSEELKNLCEVQENTMIDYIDKQHNAINLIAEVDKKLKMKKRNGKDHEQMQKKEKERIANATVARLLINCFLSKGNTNFENHPELLDLKIKWRPPISN